MTKAVMVRCYLLCLLTLTLCCACGLVWADSPKASNALIKPSTIGVPSLVHHAIPALLIPSNDKECNLRRDVGLDVDDDEEGAEENDDDEEVDLKTRDPASGASCSTDTDGRNCASGGHAVSRSLTEEAVHAAIIPQGGQHQQSPHSPPHPLHEPERGVPCTPNSSASCPLPKPPEKPLPSVLKEPEPNVPLGSVEAHPREDKPGTPAIVDDASTSSPKEDRQGMNGDKGEVDVAASAPEAEGTTGRGSNSTADNQGTAGKQPSHSSSVNSDTVNTSGSEATTAGSGITPSESTNTQEGNVGNTETTTTTTTLPPELTNNKKGDADSSSSISSSVWVCVPLLIVVTLACILVC
ncbi:uncharacterized protein TM35_000531080 [Trypanosoma theileri]|uniref:Mucin TcMUCII n=1 Tax=Trypanosoma theileri TaxID=67003 RepID=A0A1X0NGL9_9TRYP|nr:uncharacterized protein TM35_000531080 [Trypanosoma theileri]ORC83924.1 hypothetical protein TM35_000531080 [Trypanosoma theileri]